MNHKIIMFRRLLSDKSLGATREQAYEIVWGKEPTAMLVIKLAERVSKSVDKDDAFIKELSEWIHLLMKRARREATESERQRIQEKRIKSITSRTRLDRDMARRVLANGPDLWKVLEEIYKD